MPSIACVQCITIQRDELTDIAPLDLRRFPVPSVLLQLGEQDFFRTRHAPDSLAGMSIVTAIEGRPIEGVVTRERSKRRGRAAGW